MEFAQTCQQGLLPEMFNLVEKVREREGGERGGWEEASGERAGKQAGRQAGREAGREELIGV